MTFGALANAADKHARWPIMISVEANEDEPAWSVSRDHRDGVVVLKQCVIRFIGKTRQVTYQSLPNECFGVVIV